MDPDPGSQPTPNAAPRTAHAEPRQKPPTIYDVAARAGVSHQTVTRLLTGYEGIRPATRSRVEEAIATLGYRPNHAARLLRTNRSHRLGMLAHDMKNNGPVSMIHGASRRARELGYLLDIVSLEDLDTASILDAIDVLEQQQVAGILATAQTVDVHAMLSARSSLAPLYISERVGAASPDAPSINDRAGEIAGRFLAGLGHRRTMVILGPPSWVSSQDRLTGFRAALASIGGEEPRIEEGDWSAESGYRAGWRFDPAAGITAVFAQNDQMALGFIAALTERGIRVPVDVSVVGIDDMPEARFLTPPLSTVWMDFETEGAYAVDSLVALVQGIPAPGDERLPRPELRARASAIAIGAH